MSQCDAILEVLKDGQFHTIQAIHAIVGPCRLNSRIAELRTRGHNIICHREISHYDHRRPVIVYRYKLLSAALESGIREGAVPDSSAAGGQDATLSPVLPVGPTLDEVGIDRAAAAVNAEFPGMLLEDGEPVSERLSLEDQRAELAKMQQALFGDRQAA